MRLSLDARWLRCHGAKLFELNKTRSHHAAPLSWVVNRGKEALQYCGVTTFELNQMWCNRVHEPSKTGTSLLFKPWHRFV